MANSPVSSVEQVAFAAALGVTVAADQQAAEATGTDPGAADDGVGPDGQPFSNDPFNRDPFDVRPLAALLLDAADAA